MSKTWIWSDLHLGHKNIIKYCNRPFKDTAEMDAALIQAWQDTVGKEDTIINLGDVAMGGYPIAKLQPIISSLPGHKILILGNHDFHRPAGYWREVGFDEVYRHSIIYDQWYILSHAPVFLNEKMPYNNIHGHTHDKSYASQCYTNVSVEVTGYKPVDFDVIKAAAATREGVIHEAPEDLK